MGLFLASCAGRVAEPKEVASLSAETLRSSVPPDMRLELAHAAWIQAMTLDQQGQPQLALEEVQMAAFYDPDNRWLQVNLAQRLRDFRRSAEALAVLRRALKLPGEETTDELELAAGLWQENGSKDSAISAWRRVLALDPHSREALLNQAGLAEGAGRYAEAAPLYARLAEEYGIQSAPLVERAMALWMRAGLPDSAGDFLQRRWTKWHSPADGENLARFLMASGKSDDAAEILDSVAELAPEDSPRLELMAARALLASGHRDESLTRFREMDHENPNDIKIRSSLGAILLDMDSLDEATRIFAEISRLDTTNAIPYYFLGLCALKAHSPDSARLFLDKSLSLDSTAIDTWIRRGVMELEEGKPEQASAVFQRMVAAWPRLAQAHFLLGFSLAQQAVGRTRHTAREWSPPDSEPMATLLRQQALIELDSALSIDSGLPSARFERGALLERLGKWKEAHLDLAAAIQENPNDFNAANYLGYMLADRNESLDEAQDLILRAVAHDPDNPSFLDSRGWLRFRQGRLQEAIQDVDSAIALGENDPILRAHKARILEALQRPTQARELWLSILKEDAKHPEALQGLERTK